MRYQDWDILLYPKGCDVPFREFKTTCFSVQEDAGGGAMSGNSKPALSDVFRPFRLAYGWLMCNHSNKPDATAHMFRAWRSSGKPVQYLLAFVDSADACRITGYVRTR